MDFLLLLLRAYVLLLFYLGFVFCTAVRMFAETLPTTLSPNALIALLTTAGVAVGIWLCWLASRPRAQPAPVRKYLTREEWTAKY